MSFNQEKPKSPEEEKQEAWEMFASELEEFENKHLKSEPLYSVQDRRDLKEWIIDDLTKKVESKFPNLKVVLTDSLENGFARAKSLFHASHGSESALSTQSALRDILEIRTLDEQADLEQDVERRAAEQDADDLGNLDKE